MTDPACAHHPDRTTRLSCGHCATPICVDCQTCTRVGPRCPPCAGETLTVAPEPPGAADAPVTLPRSDRRQFALTLTLVLLVAWVAPLLVVSLGLAGCVAVARTRRTASSNALLIGSVYSWAF